MARIGLEWQSGQDKASRGKDLGYRVVGSQLSCTRVDRLGAMGEVPGAPRLCCPGMPSFGYRIDITGSSTLALSKQERVRLDQPIVESLLWWLHQENLQDWQSLLLGLPTVFIWMDASLEG